MKEKFFEKYRILSEEIDEQCSSLWQLYKGEMQCKPGCASCCQAFRVLPIEYHAIKNAIGSEKIEINKEAGEGQCRFLVNDACSIYEHRPVICRTHGFPLYRLNDEVEAYEISFCPLNFEDYPFEKFTTENLFPEDKYNSKLYMLNKEFIQDCSEQKYDPLELIELNELSKGLNKAS